MEPEWDPNKAEANEIMKRTAAEPYRDVNFSKGKRGRVLPVEPGKEKISIRLDREVLEHFRAIVRKAGGGNYQSLINDALREHIHQRSVLEAVRKVVREEMKRGAA